MRSAIVSGYQRIERQKSSAQYSKAIMAVYTNKFSEMRPRAKHIGIKYLYFRNKAEDGTITVIKIDTKDQQVNILTKNLAKDQFLKLRKLVYGL
eukprot:11610856-Ditylum_brightwellii.AAC.1